MLNIHRILIAVVQSKALSENESFVIVDNGRGISQFSARNRAAILRRLLQGQP